MDIRKIIKEELTILTEVRKTGGDCYVANGRKFLDKYAFLKGYTIVHGEVAGQGNLKGISFGHCWIEDKNNVYDYSNKSEKTIPKVLYYAIGNIDYINNFFKYDLEQYQKNILKYKNWGPWDLKTKY